MLKFFIFKGLLELDKFYWALLNIILAINFSSLSILSSARKRSSMRIFLRRQSMYLLPNLFTTGSLFCGFYSIYAASLGQITLSAFAIFVAMIMDTLDGRIARLTNTQSRFGAGYDSLIDIISFGIAPSLLAYSWGLQNFSNMDGSLHFSMLQQQLCAWLVLIHAP